MLTKVVSGHSFRMNSYICRKNRNTKELKTARNLIKKRIISYVSRASSKNVCTEYRKDEACIILTFEQTLVCHRSNISSY
jgi:hypothetical protein